jgi:hypothetical protein
LKTGSSAETESRFTWLYRPKMPQDQDHFFVHGVSGVGVGEQTFGFNSNSEEYYATVWWVGPPQVTLEIESFRAVYEPGTERVASYTGYAREALQVRAGDDLWWTPDHRLPLQ